MLTLYLYFGPFMYSQIPQKLRAFKYRENNLIYEIIIEKNTTKIKNIPYSLENNFPFIYILYRH